MPSEKVHATPVKGVAIKAAYKTAINNPDIINYTETNLQIKNPVDWLDNQFNWFFDGDLDPVIAFVDFFSDYKARTESAKTILSNSSSVAEYSHMMQLENMIAEYIIEATELNMVLADYGSPLKNTLVYEDETVRVKINPDSQEVDGLIEVELLRSDFKQDSADTIFGLDELLEGRIYNANYMLRKQEWLPDFTFNDDSYDYAWFTYTYCRGKSERTEDYINKVAEKLKSLLGCLKLYHYTCNGTSSVVAEIFNKVGFKSYKTLDGTALNM